MATLTVEIKGGKELARKLGRFGMDILDLSDSMNQSGRYLSRFFAGEVFASRGRVIGKPWPQLHPSYAVYKAEQWPGRPPLIRTGLMNRSFKHSAERLGAELWNEAEYFDYHQDGRGVPQRVMMAVDDTRAQRVGDFVADDIEKKMEYIGV